MAESPPPQPPSPPPSPPPPSPPPQQSSSSDSPDPPLDSIQDDLGNLSLPSADNHHHHQTAVSPVEESEKEEKLKEEGNHNNGEIEKVSGDSKTIRFPVRVGAEDCSFYMKTRTCKFGLQCKFNHPPLSKHPQGGKAKGKGDYVDTPSLNEKEDDDSIDKENRVDCKYFDRPGGCKFGNACKFNHSKKASPTSELNFMGLPIRPGEKECPYYMRNGSCKFGVSCRFNHPDPTSSGGQDALSSYGNGELVQSTNVLQSTPKTWSPPPAVNENSAYLPVMFPRNQGPLSRPEWTPYQTSVYPPGTIPMAPTYAMYNQPSETNVFSHQRESIDEFPERPGQPECTFFMKTGNCKYKSACKFHHPKNVLEKSSACSLSELGLPLRPGENICSYYSRYGICKYGPACKYDHPVNHDPSSAVDITPGFGTSMINNHVMAAGS